MRSADVLVGISANGWYVIKSSDRMGTDTYEFAGRSMRIVENYLCGALGSYVRRDDLDLKLPFERGNCGQNTTSAHRNSLGDNVTLSVTTPGNVVAIAAIIG